MYVILGKYSNSCTLVSLWVRWKCLMRCERYGICATNPVPSAQCIHLLGSLWGSSDTSLWSTGTMYLPFVSYRDTGCHWALRYLHASPGAHPCKNPRYSMAWMYITIRFSFLPPFFFQIMNIFFFKTKLNSLLLKALLPPPFDEHWCSFQVLMVTHGTAEAGSFISVWAHVWWFL